MLVLFYFYSYYLTALGCSTGGGRHYSDTHKEIRLYIKGTIQNKVHTMQIQTYTVTRSAYVTRINIQ
jgi:hypothetical protein